MGSVKDSVSKRSTRKRLPSGEKTRPSGRRAPFGKDRRSGVPGSRAPFRSVTATAVAPAGPKK